MNSNSLTPFVLGYIECGLWLAEDGTREPDDNGSESVALNELGFDASDLEADSLATVLEACEDFEQANSEALDAYYAAGFSPGDAGHDFFLTRSGHGSGFWDRGLGALGDALADACKPYGAETFTLIDLNGVDRVTVQD